MSRALAVLLLATAVAHALAAPYSKEGKNHLYAYMQSAASFGLIVQTSAVVELCGGAGLHQHACPGMNKVPHKQAGVHETETILAPVIRLPNMLHAGGNTRALLQDASSQVNLLCE
jgi:hypothetical protein